MMKRIISVFLIVTLMLTFVPMEPVWAAWTEPKTVEIANQYIKVTVSRDNGGYVIATKDGDILKKSDDDMALTHRGANMDTSFTSFRIGDKDYIFGNDYGFLGQSTTAVTTAVDPMGAWVASTWSVKDVEIEQKITLVNSEISEQLGTAMISYTVKNKGTGSANVKSRVLIDTQLGDKDYGYYELPKQNLGQGYEYFEFERTWDSIADPTIRMPADYFVRDNPFASAIVGFGVNSVFEDQKPYKMTFAHWANIAATKFDYAPDLSLNFTNGINGTKTADSAAALYYDLGPVAGGGEKSFSTYYGVTANLKNKDNKILINTTAPSKLEFTDDSNTAYKGSEKDVGENIVRINTTITNPSDSKKMYDNLAVVVYALGFETQRQTDLGNWVEYDNSDPVYTDVISFEPGQNRTTYFDFKFTPDKNAQLGSFVTKVFDMDEDVNELGSYAEEYCLGTTENFIVLPGTDPDLPAITLAEIGPKILYNDDTRYLTVTGQGMSFFRSDLLNKIELRGENGKTHEVPIGNLTYEQGDRPKSVTMQISGYMEPGPYELHFLWKTDTGETALQGVPTDFTSSAMFVHMSGDPKYRNDQYGVVTVQRDEGNKYKVVPYKNESAFSAAGVNADDLLLSFRGDILQDRENKNFYRMLGKNKNININHMLNYYGSDLTIEQKNDGTAEVLMDGKITTIGANTTVRDGTAAFRLKAGTEYIVPLYNARGEIKSGDSIALGQDYIELKWDNAFDTLRTIGGFLIDLKYGVLGKIQNSDGSTYDIISFGGGLDLGFLTPGGAAKARQNKKGGDSWTRETVVDEDDDPDGFGFGLNFDDETGDITAQTKEVDAPPKNSKPSRVEAGAAIHDILYGGKSPGYIGINMDAHVSLPQLVSFLPNKIEADLGINTIGGYQVGFDGKVKTATMEMQLSLVIKSNPSGAPIPDKLYFTIGGFEPGFNVDGAGVLWITGGGGGFDKLYDTIYGKDGIPPLTLLLHVEFDVTKILSGSADLELSLRSISISFDDLSLKKLKDAKFIDGGLAAIGWYPNFSLNLRAGVTYMQILKGSMQITAGAGGDTKAFFEFVLRVSLTLPKIIPVVGGMQIASAELGGGTEKVWGTIILLEIVKVGFVYYWGGDVEFTAGNVGGGESMGLAPSGQPIMFADAGERRSFALYKAMTAPREVGADPETGESQFVSVGSNLSFVAGSKVAADFADMAAQAMQPAGRMRALAATPTQIYANEQRTSHLVQFGDADDYILTVSRADGEELTGDYLQEHMTVKQNGSLYPLKYYTAPGAGATDTEKENALKTANVNIAGGVAYIVIPHTDLTINKNFLIEFNDNKAYDVGAIYVDPISELKTCGSSLSGNSLTVNWTGENISDTAKIIVSISDIEGQDGVILNTVDIFAKYTGDKGEAVLNIPSEMAGGKYYVTLTLSDEEKCFEKYEAGSVNVTNSKAPGAPISVVLSNAGNDKLKADITPADPGDAKLKGYFIDVYEDGTLVDAGLYFDKDDDILIGGRYDVPVMDGEGKPTGQSVTVGYTPRKRYSIKARAGNIEDPDPDIDGDEIYHCSSYVNSEAVALKGATPPKLTIAYDRAAGNALITSDVAITGELYINGDIEDGKWYKFDTPATRMAQPLSLPDGEHSLEFHAVDGDGDHAIVQQIVNIDTTPPSFMLEAPLSGNTFSGNTILVRGTADHDAVYTFKLNGEAVIPIEKDNIFKDGLLSCTLPLGSAANSSKAALEITAADAAGNAETKLVELTNAKLADINSIAIYKEASPAANGQISLNEAERAELRLMGFIKGGTTIDITDSPASRLEVFGGSSASLEGNLVTAKAEGQTLLRAQYDLGGGRMLQDGVVIAVAESAYGVSLSESGTYTFAGRKEGYGSTAYREVIVANIGSQSTGELAVSLSGRNGSSFALAGTPISNIDKGGTGRFSIKPKDNLPAGTYEATVTVSGSSGITASFNVSFTVSPKDTSGGDDKDDGGGSKGSADAGKAAKEDKTPSPLTPEAKWENPFADIKESDWFYSYVEYVCSEGLFNGTTESTFSPAMPMTRSMLATVLWRMDGSPKPQGKTFFADLQDGWYKDAVLWASENNIVSGYGGGLFGPDDNITREQMAVMLYRYSQYKGYDVTAGADLSGYIDAEDISGWALAAMKWANDRGLITGRSDKELASKAKAGRAEIAAILYRFMTRYMEK
ncbi:S-layer homology domain-containing protein [Lutispora saccharofermentans]|uniref:S-layer homology domain-containing protein n=1 Tax=Lutispora saccharofermentans TaxID=3024236 RepID=A0ABT1NJF2_9FIRM|nr:S-layer homology domain-containing protein [Lutispora saccharofermentans]MCQ1530283.1 S-layer homology domain-containing protein [Lutispora saccharofermentans]